MANPLVSPDEEFIAATGYREVNDEEAKVSLDTYSDYKAARSERYADQVENDNFYHGRQYDEQEKSDITARGQAPLVTNVMYSILKQIISLITSENPEWWVDPVGGTDKQYAYMMRQLLQHTWYTSKGGRQLTQITKEMCITGHGIAIVTPEHAMGDFYAKFGHIPYHQFYVAPDTREFDYSDSESQIISRVISHKSAADMLGVDMKKMEEIAKTDTSDADSDDSANAPRIRYMTPAKKSRTVRIIQRLTMERTKVYIVSPRNSNDLTHRVYFSLPEGVKKGKEQGLFNVIEQDRMVVAKYISVGDYCKKYYMPISRYNTIPFIDEFNGNPYPLGEVDFLYGLQRALNKFMLLAILNATLSNSMRMMAPKGTVNKDDYQNNFAVPGSLTEYDWTEGQPTPQAINPVPLSSEFYATPRMLINMMEYLTGIFGVVQGNPEGAPRTASGLMSLQNYGGQKVKLLGRNVAESLSLAGDIAIEIYQNYAPYNGIASYYSPGESEPTTVKYNQLQSEDGGNIRIKNDITVGRFKTRVHLAQNYGSERNAKATLLANLASQTGSPALIGPILKLADIPEADEIAQAVDVVSQQSSTIEQLSASLKRTEEINKQLQNEIIQKSQNVSLVEFQAQLDILYAKIKAELGAGVATQLTKTKADLEAQVNEAIAKFSAPKEQSQTA